MPYDEAILDDTIGNLQAKYEELQLTFRDIKQVMTRLTSIQDVEKIEIIKNKRVSKFITPIDDGTGAEITGSRRDEIFDAFIPKARALLK